VAGRPRRFDGDTAIEDLPLVFWKRGYDYVTQQQMAQVTGLTTSGLYGTFYRTFGIKPQTVEHVLRRYRVVADGLLVPLRDGRSGTEYLRVDRLQWEPCVSDDRVVA
jgi:hypothetical protein